MRTSQLWDAVEWLDEANAEAVYALCACLDTVLWFIEWLARRWGGR